MVVFRLVNSDMQKDDPRDDEQDVETGTEDADESTLMDEEVDDDSEGTRPKLVDKAINGALVVVEICPGFMPAPVPTLLGVANCDSSTRGISEMVEPSVNVKSLLLLGLLSSGEMLHSGEFSLEIAVSIEKEVMVDAIALLNVAVPNDTEAAVDMAVVALLAS